KIATFTDLLDERYAERLDDDGKAYIRHAHDAARRMQSLIRDLLTYSRVGHDPLPYEPVDGDALMRKVRQDVELRLVEAGGRLTWTSMPEIWGAPTLLQQLLVNLVDNGLKFR